MANKNPLDDVVAGIVAFRMGENGEWASNSPLWADSTLREHWLARHGAGTGDDSVEGVEDLEGDDYETWTNEELRTELAGRGLAVEGKKTDLIARLRENDNAGV